ncbi:hypothetical protein GCM10009616_35050 [Microlunatus lacustris]
MHEIAKLDLLHISGYWLLGGVELNGLTDQRSVCITVDLGNVSRVQACGGEFVRQTLMQLRPATVFANRAESDAAELLTHPHVAELYVITNGDAPTLLSTPTGSVLVPVPQLEHVVDTTGAGDAFAAGFLASSARGADAVQAVHIGHAAAREVIQRPGAS